MRKINKKLLNYNIGSKNLVEVSTSPSWQNAEIVKPDAMTRVRIPVPPLVCVSL